MDYKKLTELRNKTNPFAGYLNIKITNISEGAATAEMPITENCLNPGGSVHGGCLYTLADVAGGSAASSCGRQIVTADSSFYFLKAGLNTKHLTGKAREIKRGKRLMIYDVTIYDDQNQLLAEGTFTYAPLDIPIFSE